MQFLLTEEDLSKLTDKKTSDEKIKDMTEALEWCRQQLMIEDCGETYCDSCPVSSIGHTHFPKKDPSYEGQMEYIDKNPGIGNTPTHKISNLVCPIKYGYSK